MAIPPEVQADAETALTEFCAKLASAEVQELRYTYEVTANSAYLIEQRPSFMNPEEWTSRPIAKFRYSPAKNVWSLYWSDRGDRWHRLAGKATAPDIRELIKNVATDPSGVFWT